MIRVKGYTNLYRDETSGAIVNCDSAAYNQYLNIVNNRESQKKELDNIKVSYYHILNKSPELRTVIERIYNINFPKESELKSRLDWNKEIYNYTKVMNQELILS